MASISAHTFEIVRFIGTDGYCEMLYKSKKKGRTRRFDLYLKKSSVTRWTLRSGEIALPRKMRAAMIQACILFDRENTHMRPKWRPRWQA